MLTSHRTAALIAILTLAGSAYGQRNGLDPLPAPRAPVENPVTSAKTILGKILFWDEQLSSDNTIACGTCHRPSSGGADPRFRRHPGRDGELLTDDDVLGSPGVVRRDTLRRPAADPVFALRPQVTARTAPSNLGVANAPSLFWDGRAEPEFVDPLTGDVVIEHGGALESQALGPILNTTEMAHEGRSWSDVTSKLAEVTPLALATEHPSDVAEALREHETYARLFGAAFGDPAITPVRIAFAIATYERTLVPDQTPFDGWLAGSRRAMTRNQQRGFDEFRRARCVECHVPPEFTDFSFRNIGLHQPSDDQGHRTVSGNVRDRGTFKVPSLRNVGLRPRFMHTGEFTELEDVVLLYHAIGQRSRSNSNVDAIIGRGLRVRPGSPAIVDFLSNALTDPRVANEEYPFDRPTLRSERAERR